MISGKRKLGIGVKSENGKSRRIKVTLQEAIRNDDFQHNTALQHCFNIATLCCARNFL